MADAGEKPEPRWRIVDDAAYRRMLARDQEVLLRETPPEAVRERAQQMGMAA